MEEDQQQHFGVPEVDNINEDNSSNEEEGVGGDEVEEDLPVQLNEKVVDKIKEEDGPAKIDEEENPASDDEGSLPDSAQEDKPSIGSVDTVDDKVDKTDVIDNEPTLQPEEPPPQIRAGNPVSAAAVRELDSNLDGAH